MSLSCECGEWDGDGWGYYIPDNFIKLKIARTTCCSCKVPIRVSEECIKFLRMEYTYYEDEKHLKPWYMCESCGEIYLNLTDIGYCVDLGDDDMHDLLKEYHALTGFNIPKWTQKELDEAAVRAKELAATFVV